MSTRLHPRLPLAADETALSWATRLAAMHTGARVPGFLRDVGIEADAFLRGEDAALARLAELGGEPQDRVTAAAIRRTAGGLLSLGDQGFTTDPATVFCPHCLMEDEAAGGAPALARRGRLIWKLRPVRVCPAHRVALIRRAPAAWDDRFHELAVRVPERGHALARLAEAAAPVAPTPLQDYVVARLAGQPGPAWLDGQTIEQAVLASEWLGLALAFGPLLDPERPLTEADHDEAARVGFAVTARGEEAVRAALAEMQARPVHAGGRIGAQAVFGVLYQRLQYARTECDPGPIRAVLRAHILETMEVAPGTELLGATVETRRLHSVASLSKQTGQHHHTLRNLLVARGLVPEIETGPPPCVMDAETAEAAVSGLQETVWVTGLRRALDCSRPMAEQMVATGLLEPVARDAATRRGTKRCGVTKEQVDRFLARLAELAPPVAEVPEGHVTLAKAAERSRSTSVALLRGVLAGEITGAVSAPGAHGIAALRVPRAALPAPDRPSAGRLPVSAVFARLRLSHAAGRALLAARDATGAPFLASEDVKRGRSRVRLVRSSDLDAFVARFATLAQLCHETGAHPQTLRRDLEAAGVTPVLHVPRLRLRLYRRADLPRSQPDRAAA